LSAVADGLKFLQAQVHGDYFSLPIYAACRYSHFSPIKFIFYKISIFPKSEPNPSPFGHYIGGDTFFDGARSPLAENQLLICITDCVQAKPQPRLFANGDGFQNRGEKNTPENDAF
jgi:hypothetical protein